MTQLIGQKIFKNGKLSPKIQPKSIQKKIDQATTRVIYKIKRKRGQKVI